MMNSHQRKKLMVARHYRMPLGCAVRVRDGRQVYLGTVGKHDRGGRLIVHFAEHNLLSRAANPVATQPFSWVNYGSVKPVEVHRVRPWWRVLREKLRAQTTPQPADPSAPTP